MRVRGASSAVPKSGDPAVDGEGRHVCGYACLGDQVPMRPEPNVAEPTRRECGRILLEEHRMNFDAVMRNGRFPLLPALGIIINHPSPLSILPLPPTCETDPTTAQPSDIWRALVCTTKQSRSVSSPSRRSVNIPRFPIHRPSPLPSLTRASPHLPTIRSYILSLSFSNSSSSLCTLSTSTLARSFSGGNPAYPFLLPSSPTTTSFNAATSFSISTSS